MHNLHVRLQENPRSYKGLISYLILSIPRLRHFLATKQILNIRLLISRLLFFPSLSYMLQFQLYNSIESLTGCCEHSNFSGSISLHTQNLHLIARICRSQRAQLPWVPCNFHPNPKFNESLPRDILWSSRSDGKLPPPQPA